ncbi:CHAT domain-containing protein, partial [candidate division KSB1 bacterium]|nr:CHAT domain-containing protein [candidate division KSB1 bacterium]
WWSARLFSYLGIINFYQTNLDSAQMQFNQAILIQEKLGDENGLKDNYLNLGIVKYSQNELRTAGSFFNKALTLQKRLQDTFGEITTEIQLGDVAYQQYDFKAAGSWYQSAYNRAQTLGNRDLQSRSLKNLGYIDFSQHQYAPATEKLLSALTLAQQYDDPTAIWRIYQSLGMIAEKQQLTSQAFQNYLNALSYIDLTEPVKSYFTHPTEFTKNETDVYQDAMLAAKELAQRQEAPEWIGHIFDISERLQARQLYHDLQSLQVAIKDVELERRILTIQSYNRQVQALKKLLIDEKKQALLQQNISKIISLRDYLKLLEERRQQYQTQLFQGRPEFKNFFTTNRPSFSKIQASLRRGQVLLKYVKLDKHLLILKIDANQSQVYRINLTTKELLKSLEKFRATIFRPPSVAHTGAKASPAAIAADLEPLQQEFTTWLLDPVKMDLNSYQEMMIMPDPWLLHFPFEILFWKNTGAKSELLLQRFPIQYLASADLIQPNAVFNKTTPFHFLAARAPANTPSVLGENSRLNAQFFKSQPAAEAIGEWDLLEKINGQPAIIHSQIPGFWNYSQPNDSYWDLWRVSNPPHWYLANWFNLQFNAQSLLTLVNFKFGMPGVNENPGLFFLMFKILGISRLLLASWDVPAEVQAEFFPRFYAQLEDGVALTQAVRAAKLQLLRQKEYAHPYFWSGFLLYE